MNLIKPRRRTDENAVVLGPDLGMIRPIAGLVVRLWPDLGRFRSDWFATVRP